MKNNALLCIKKINQRFTNDDNRNAYRVTADRQAGRRIHYPP